MRYGRPQMGNMCDHAPYTACMLLRSVVGAWVPPCGALYGFHVWDAAYKNMGGRADESVLESMDHVRAAYGMEEHDVLESRIEGAVYLHTGDGGAARLLRSRCLRAGRVAMPPGCLYDADATANCPLTIALASVAFTRRREAWSLWSQLTGPRMGSTPNMASTTRGSTMTTTAMATLGGSGWGIKVASRTGEACALSAGAITRPASTSKTGCSTPALSRLGAMLWAGGSVGRSLIEHAA